MSKVKIFLNNLPDYLGNFFESLLVLFYVLIGTSLISIIYLLYQNISFNDLGICTSYIYAKFFVKIGFENMPITIDFSGREYESSAISIISSVSVMRIYDLITNRIVYSIITGLGISASITVFLAILIGLKVWIKSRVRNLKLKSIDQTFVKAPHESARQSPTSNIPKLNPTPVKQNPIPTATSRNLLTEILEKKSVSKPVLPPADKGHKLHETPRGSYKLTPDSTLPYPLLKTVEFIEPKERLSKTNQKPVKKTKKSAADQKPKNPDQDCLNKSNKTDSFF